MAMYKVRTTIYKSPSGKTLIKPTLIHEAGDICSAFGLIGVLAVILCFMEHWPAWMLIGSIVIGVAGFALGPVLHKKAKQAAEAAWMKELAAEEKKTD